MAHTYLSETERCIAGIFADALDLPSVPGDSEFFELGGDSQLAVRVVLEIEMRFSLQIPDDLIETAGTARRLAAWIDQRNGAGT